MPLIRHEVWIHVVRSDGPILAFGHKDRLVLVDAIGNVRLKVDHGLEMAKGPGNPKGGNVKFML